MNVNFVRTNGLVPAIIQDTDTKIVLMLGYMDQEALMKTKETGFVWFYSRSKKRLWKKGETSGNVLKVKGVAIDCDQDTLLITVQSSGSTCHTGSTSCFDSTSDVALDSSEVSNRMNINTLFARIQDRKVKLPDNSYTSSLFKAGRDKIWNKIIEESQEVIQASKSEGKQRIIEEASDVLYHLFVLLVSENIALGEVESELQNRSQK